MTSKKQEYISKYNKNNYKMYQFRVKKDNKRLIEFLDNHLKRNNMIVSLLNEQVDPSVYTIKQLKELIKPVMEKHNINEIYLFGSYSRGEATRDSDVDIYCEHGDIKTLFDVDDLEQELKTALKKDIDLVFIGSDMNWFFKEQLMKDMIKLC